MGTPQFAVPTLEAILNSHHQVVGVVTQPDRQRGRGKKLLPTPVKQFALDNHLSPILQPEKMKDPAFVTALQALDADVFVVVAFRILPEIVFAMPSHGTINLHPSLLPKFRGAAPLNWTIIQGEESTGITTIYIKKEIDAGNIIIQQPFPLVPNETVGELHDRIAPVGAQVVLDSLAQIAAGTVAVSIQDNDLATPAPKLTKETCHLDFNQPAESVKNWIHGLSPVPGAFTYYDGQLLKLFRASVIESTKNVTPGTILKAADGEIHIACRDSAISVHELQLQGKKRLTTDVFLRGNQLQEGIVCL